MEHSFEGNKTKETHLILKQHVDICGKEASSFLETISTTLATDIEVVTIQASQVDKVI